jgi:type III secretion protein L
MAGQNPKSPDDLPAEPGSRILRAADVDAWRDGYGFLAAAREAAATAEENARRAYDSAYEKGFAEGRAAGAIEASRLVRDTTLAVDRYLAKLEKDIGTLALSIVRRVIGEIDVAERVAHAAVQAMTEFRHEKNLRIAVHPGAVGHISAALAALPQDDQPAVTVEPDPALDEGACILVSDFAIVDASIEVQLRAFEASLPSHEQGATP